MLDTIVFYAVSSPNYCPNIKLQMTRIDLQIFDVVVVALVIYSDRLLLHYPPISDAFDSIENLFCIKQMIQL